MPLRSQSVRERFDCGPSTRVIRHLRNWILEGLLPEGAHFPSLLQLARKLNVSKSTIRFAMEELIRQGMIRKENSRRLVVSKQVAPPMTLLSNSIGVIAEIPAQRHVLNKQGICAQRSTYAGAVRAIRSAGYDVLTLHPKRLQGQSLQRFVAERPAGILFLVGCGEELHVHQIGEVLRQANIPFAAEGGLGFSPRTDPFPEVVSDNETGSYELTRWLIRQGRTRILRFWLLPPNEPAKIPPWLEQRNLGYERAMAESGLKALPAVQMNDFQGNPVHSTETDFRIRSRWMAGYLVEHLHGPEAVDAIITITDATVGHLANALRVHGKKPNDDVLLAGYDNTWEQVDSRRWEPLGPVASVDPKNLLIGTELVNLLRDQIDGKLDQQSHRRIVSPTLVLRPSAYPAGGDLPEEVRIENDSRLLTDRALCLSACSF